MQTALTALMMFFVSQNRWTNMFFCQMPLTAAHLASIWYRMELYLFPKAFSHIWTIRSLAQNFMLTTAVPFAARDMFGEENPRPLEDYENQPEQAMTLGGM